MEFRRENRGARRDVTTAHRARTNQSRSHTGSKTASPAHSASFLLSQALMASRDLQDPRFFVSFSFLFRSFALPSNNATTDYSFSFNVWRATRRQLGMQVRSTNAAWVGLVFSPLLVLVFISLSAGGALHTTECRYCRKSMVLYPDLPDSLSLPLSSLPLSSNQVGALAHVTKRQITKAAVCFGTAEWLKFKGGIFGPLL